MDIAAWAKLVGDRRRVAIPPVFVAMHAEGLLDPLSPRCLLFSDVEFLPLTEVATSLAPVSCSADIDVVAFAASARGDVYGWSPAVDTGEIVFAHADERSAYVFARSFEAAIYRLFLRELAGSDLVDIGDWSPGHFVPNLTSQVAAVEAYLPEAWVTRLKHALLTPPQEDGGTYSIISDAEYERILEADLGLGTDIELIDLGLSG